jgi:hypothetical protein
LRHLEETVGRETFDEYLKGYFDRHAFQSLTTADFEADALEHLFADLKPPQRARIVADFRAWLTEPGLPANAPQPSSARLEALQERGSKWLAGEIDAAELGAGDWSTQEWVFFLNALPPTLPADRLAELDAAYHLTEKANAEVLVPWLRHAIRSGYDQADERLETFLTSVGRRKYLMPLYEELVKTPAGRQRAKALFAKARLHYHPIAAESVDRVVNKP